MDARLQQLQEEVARRVAPVLCDVPTALFEELVYLVASMQYEREPERRSNRDRELHER